jgi:FkbM family methyltransferase
MDAGCGVGFFSQILLDCGLGVRGFDGRRENVEEARKRFPQIVFEQGDIQNGEILHIGSSDLLLCFGLLYHLENPMAAIRHLRSLTEKGLLLESMCLPDDKPWMLLREEPALADQSLTNIAFYASEGCLAKMLYRAGFAAVYRVTPLPQHDDYRDTEEHARRRTVLFASTAPIDFVGFQLFPEPAETGDPWTKITKNSQGFARRLSRFARKPLHKQYRSLAIKIQQRFPFLPIPMRLPYGGWWLAGIGAVDRGVLLDRFESSELRFVERFIKPGMTVFDVGAHHGLYTILASKATGAEGRVHAFEPSPRERAQLKRNLGLNRARNVQIHSVALGRESGKETLYLVDGTEDGCNSLRAPNVEQVTIPVEVRVQPLDDFLRQSGVQGIDFVKLDVEGAELSVLEGAEGLFRSPHRPVILAEISDVRTGPWGYAAREIIEWLGRKGFEWFELTGKGGLRRADLRQAFYDHNLVAVPGEKMDQIQQLLEAD